MDSGSAATPITQQTEQTAPVPSGGDLFSMLNQNISQSTPQANQMPGVGGSAFNFMQNQSSLSISVKSDKQTPGKPGESGQPSAAADIEEFEELSESREIIEDRIFRLKLQMIDLTIH